MKSLYYSLMFFGNLMFLLVNGWKIAFTFHPSSMAIVGAAVAFANLCFVLPFYIKSHFYKQSHTQKEDRR